MHSYRRGLQVLRATTPSPALRLGGNQRIGARLYSILSETSTRRPAGIASNSSRHTVLALRSEFSTLGARWNASKPDGEKKPAEESAEPESEKTEEQKKAEEEAEKKKNEKPPPPPPKHGDKTPLAVFMETLQTEFKKSQEWQESTKQLADTRQQFTESPAVRKAREQMSKTAEVAEKVGGKTAETLGKTASAIGKGASWTWNTPVVKAGRTVARKTGEGVATVTKPVRDTKIYKDVTGNIKEVIDDGSSSRYGGYLDREERKRLRELREARGEIKKFEKFEEDPEAGTNVTLHKDAAWKESWRTFRDSNPMMQRIFSIPKKLEESENPVVEFGRSISDRFAGFFAENETAMVIRKMREVDPNFQLEPFLRDLREYILPEVLDAYVKGDSKTLKEWLSEAQFNVFEALQKQYKTQGLKLDGKVLDVRGVDVVSARILDPGDIPVFIISCRTNEVHVYRDVKTNKVKAGVEDKVMQVTYAMGLTRIAEDVANPETAGWRLIELQKSARDFI
ncbi:TIM44 subunit of mitochondria import inner membrane translocase [Ascodesmis nigricans]|uniref:Mitochondrial import inner membrane translocase subunit TIM44 n=1 Tax=Ascodesmis nigricans TaxID=341454 RepID=A0A4V3SIZ4_9PEZI|nr:TIM44 subunit of mitochondria import inner membrane translocase [Ascodesmis nigricans]